MSQQSYRRRRAYLSSSGNHRGSASYLHTTTVHGKIRLPETETTLISSFDWSSSSSWSFNSSPGPKSGFVIARVFKDAVPAKITSYSPMTGETVQALGAHSALVGMISHQFGLQRQPAG